MAGDRVAHSKAIKAAQALLSIDNPSIAVDGVWGPRSQAAFDANQSKAGELVRSVKKFADTLKPVEPGVGTWISRRDALRLIENAAVVAGIPKEWLEFMLDMEPSRRNGPTGLEYRVDSVSPGGSYFGLMQVGAPAWEDAYKRFPTVGSFQRNKFVPELNVLAAAGYALANVGYARSLHGFDGPFTPEIVYAMHNQGHTFISSAKRGGMGRYANGQSADAREVLASAARTVRELIS